MRLLYGFLQKNNHITSSKIIKNNNRTVIKNRFLDNDLSVMEVDNKNALLKLASKVKKLRVIKGVTQEIALIDTGIHFGRIEQGKRDISYTTLIKLCNYFDITPSEFFKDDFSP